MAKGVEKGWARVAEGCALLAKCNSACAALLANASELRSLRYCTNGLLNAASKYRIVIIKKTTWEMFSFV